MEDIENLEKHDTSNVESVKITKVNGSRNKRDNISSEETPSKIRKLDDETVDRQKQITRQKRLCGLDHYGVTANEVSNMLFNIVMERMAKMVPGITNVILSTFKEGEDREKLNDDLKAATDSFIGKFYGSVSNMCNKFESLLTHIMTLSDGFVLEDDKVQIDYKEMLKKRGFTDPNIGELEQNLSDLRESILAEIKKRLQLEYELKLLQKTKERIVNLQKIANDVLPKIDDDFKKSQDNLNKSSAQFNKIEAERLISPRKSF